MNTYETIYIAPGDLPQEKIDTALEKVKSVITRASGKIISAELWGRRKLSFPIKRNRDGFYIYLLYSASPEAPSLLDHHFRVTDTILRGLTVKVDPRHLEKLRAPIRALSETPAPAVAGAPVPAAAPAEAAAPKAQPTEITPTETR